MQDVVSSVAHGRHGWWSFVASRVRIGAPTLTEWAAGLLTATLLILAFPDFGLWILAWVSLIPLLLVIARRPSPFRVFAIGLLAGTVFFYGSCYWLTHSMIHYGRLPVWVAFPLLLPGSVILGLFPATFALVLSLAIRRWRNKAVLLAPFIWVSLEWARLGITGQLWNAIGYSQAYQPSLIQSARFGGVYAVGFLILAFNSAAALLILNRDKRTITISFLVILAVLLLGFGSNAHSRWAREVITRTEGERIRNAGPPDLFVVALQPNVPMDPSLAAAELENLLSLHLSESTKALARLPPEAKRLVIWPESPMNFVYGTDREFQNLVARFVRQHHTTLLFNSLERASGDGAYNSAVMVDEEGRAIAQYDKIRLMPFGEYVPLPAWLPGTSLVTAIVGDFTPGTKYTLFPAGRFRAGVFICIEAAYPSIARTFTAEGADVLINISNDGYLGPTAVMRQHLANAVFRAVENDRPLLRVTNSGITAFITGAGEVKDETNGFQRTVRTWSLYGSQPHTTFYTRYGDLFAGTSALLTAVICVLSWRRKKELRG